ncbi:MAG: D-alanyl-D-alanine carboxypeptidase [Cuniculiplasma divulgatum]|jgi:D-alanyl-D-alanine carboxypeptidase/D-alanyl-D-alanine-endopeptidase (penicillin-binding protein 4)
MKIHKESVTSFCFLNSDGKNILSKNENLPVIPASNMKLITSLCALESLGRDFVFTTNFSSDKDNLHITGDPSFFLNIGECRRIIRELQIEKVNTIYLEMPRIDREFYNSDWVYGDSKYSYQPRISNFFIGENCKIKNSSKFDDNDFNYIHQNEQFFQPVKNPDKHLIEAFSEEKNLRTIRKGLSSNNNFEKVISHSANIRDVLRHILFESCNFYTEVIFKYLSSSEKSLGTWENSSKFVMDYISRINGSENVRIKDGSGLSRENFLTTGFLSNMLLYAKKNFGNTFIELMPTIGQGTLRKRLISLEKNGIYAKTGTLSGVSALSGYISSMDTFFSIIINNSLDEGSVRQMEIDRILSEFIDKYK